MEPKKNPTKDVHRYAKHFFLIGLIISSSIAIMAFEWRTEVKKITVDTFNNSDVEPMTLYPIPVTIQTNVSNAPKPKKVQWIDPNRLTPEPSTNTTVKKEEPEIEIESPTTGSSTNFSIEVEKEIPQDTFIVVEHMPVPIGGYERFYKQVSKEIKYPTLAKRNYTEGKVFVEFVINELGDPINLKIIKGIGYGCDEEAKRVISMIKWQPGSQRGRPALVKMTLPIQFRLQ